MNDTPGEPSVLRRQYPPPLQPVGSSAEGHSHYHGSWEELEHSHGQIWCLAAGHSHWEDLRWSTLKNLLICSPLTSVADEREIRHSRDIGEDEESVCWTHQAARRGTHVHQPPQELLKQLVLSLAVYTLKWPWPKWLNLISWFKDLRARCYYVLCDFS